MKSTLKILLGTLIIITAAVLLINKCNIENKAKLDYYAALGPKTSNQIPPDYSNLFNGRVSGLAFSKTLIFKNRNPISIFNYDNKYTIEVDKIDLSNEFSLKTIIEKSRTSKRLENIYYAIDQQGDMEFNYNNSYRLRHLSKLYLLLSGNNTQQIVKNDSVAYYNSNIKNLSIQGEGNGKPELLVISKDKNNKGTPVEILFLKKGNALYILLMAPKKINSILNSNTLFDLVTNFKQK